MSRAIARIVAMAVLGLAVAAVSVAAMERPSAASWKHWLPLKHWRQGDPHQVSAGPPGPHRYPQHAAGNHPWYGYGFGVPTYNWGYFGAYPYGTCQGIFNTYHGYHGDFHQWSCQRGY